MKCPLNGLCECDPECALLLRTKDGRGECRGYVCAFASLGTECAGKLNTIARCVPCEEVLCKPKDDEVIEG